MVPYFRKDMETMGRDELDALVDERIRYTVKYAYENSLFYRKWFDKKGIKYGDVRSHEISENCPLFLVKQFEGGSLLKQRSLNLSVRTGRVSSQFMRLAAQAGSRNPSS